EGADTYAKLWAPDAEHNGGQNAGDPSLCPAPRDPSTSPSDQYTLCPTDDIETLTQAHDFLTDVNNGAKVKLAFIHLAELGAIKRQYGDTDSFSSGSGGGNSNSQQAVADALHKMDSAVGQFVGRYSQDGAGKDKWNQTVMLVTGDHGYEATPVANRVPDPNNPQDPSKDLTDYVKAASADKNGAPQAVLVPQGTL